MAYNFNTEISPNLRSPGTRGGDFPGENISWKAADIVRVSSKLYIFVNNRQMNTGDSKAGIPSVSAVDQVHISIESVECSSVSR